MKKYGLKNGRPSAKAEDDDEDVAHAFLRIDGADVDDFLAVVDRRGVPVELDVFLDVDDRAIGAGDDGLRARAGEPVNHRAAHEQAEDDFGLHEAQDAAIDVAGTPMLFEQHDDAENHRGCADDGGADKHRLGRGLEGVARAVAFFEFELGVLKVGFEAEILLDFRADVRARLRSGSIHKRIARCR